MDNTWMTALALTILALGMFAVAWRSRVRAVRRWLTTLESYAEREIAQERRRRGLLRQRS
jgi:hypothetical protein